MKEWCQGSRESVPTIILLAVLTVIVPPRIVGGNLDSWIYRSLILIVISRPSAFILLVLAAIFTAVTVAAGKGIIIKSGIYVEKMNRVKTVLLDKTGTLTLGTPKLAKECSYAHPLDNDVLKQIAALEQYSRHLLARAIIEQADREKLDHKNLVVKNLKEIQGRGIIGEVNGVHVGIGRIQMLDNREKVQGKCGYSTLGRHSKVYAIIGKSFITDLYLADEIREGAVKSIKSLKKEGLHTVMLTGDKKETANDIGKHLGVHEVYAELLPEDKLKLLEYYSSERGLVVMVGDGVNDAPALAAPDVGIAMGQTGIGVALESADVVLVNNELNNISYFYKLSKSTMGIAKQNILVSFGVKLLLGALGLFGLIPLWFTVAAGDDGVTLLLLLNNLRLAN